MKPSQISTLNMYFEMHLVNSLKRIKVVELHGENVLSCTPVNTLISASGDSHKRICVCVINCSLFLDKDKLIGTRKLSHIVRGGE